MITFTSKNGPITLEVGTKVRVRVPGSSPCFDRWEDGVVEHLSDGHLPTCTVRSESGAGVQFLCYDTHYEAPVVNVRA